MTIEIYLNVSSSRWGEEIGGSKCKDLLDDCYLDQDIYRYRDRKTPLVLAVFN